MNNVHKPDYDENGNIIALKRFALIDYEYHYPAGFLNDIALHADSLEDFKSWFDSDAGKSYYYGSFCYIFDFDLRSVVVDLNEGREWEPISPTPANVVK